MFAFLPGLFTGLSLIIAIGAQNAFVIRQGLTRRHVFAVVALCTFIDASLIALGIGGLGAALLGWIADQTSIPTVYQLCSFIPLIGLLTALLPKLPSNKLK